MAISMEVIASIIIMITQEEIVVMEGLPIISQRKEDNKIMADQIITSRVKEGSKMGEGIKKGEMQVSKITKETIPRPTILAETNGT